METPLGLNYSPIFPTVLNMMKMAEQQQAARDKAAAEAEKNALTRINQSTQAAWKYDDGKRPFMAPLEPYFQEKGKYIFDSVSEANQRLITPEELDLRVAQYKKDSEDAIRINGERVAVTEARTKSGIRDMQYLNTLWGMETHNIAASEATGKSVRLPPHLFDINKHHMKGDNDVNSYLPTVIAEKFIGFLTEKDKVETTSIIKGGTQYESVTSLNPKYISKTPGAAGQKTLDFGVIKENGDGDQSRAMLASYLSQGPEYVKFLKLRAQQDEPKFAEMQPGSEEWGIQLQKSLRSFMNERGHVATSTETTPIKPDEKEGFDPKKWIGGYPKSDLAARDAARVMARVLNHDPSTLGYFKGGQSVESTAFDNKGNLVVKFNSGGADIMAAVLKTIPQFADMQVAGKKDTFAIPLGRVSMVELINFKNIISGNHDWVPEHVEQAFDQDYRSTGATPPAQAPAAPAPNIANQYGTDDALDLSDAPSDKDLDEAIQGLPAGTKYIGKDGLMHFK